MAEMDVALAAQRGAAFPLLASLRCTHVRETVACVTQESAKTVLVCFESVFALRMPPQCLGHVGRLPFLVLQPLIPLREGVTQGRDRFPPRPTRA